MSEPKLLPCPFCGGEPVLTKMIVTPERHRPCVSCESMECPVGPCTDGFASAEEASAAWNTRTEHARIVAEKDAEIQRLREAILKFWADQCGNRACGCDEWPECTHTMAAFELHAVAHPSQKKGVSDEE